VLGIFFSYTFNLDWICIAGKIHAVAEALLIFLDSLREPVIPFSLYDDALSAATDEAASMVVSILWIVNISVVLKQQSEANKHYCVESWVVAGYYHV